MSNPYGIIVFGLNGSGKTTLGHELARILNFKHMDHEAYAFKEAEIPYADPCSHEECIALMLADIERYHSFVISAVTGNFGEKITSMYTMAVYITVPLEICIKRVKQRDDERYGARVREGGDMHESRRKFVDFVASRSLAPIEQWAQKLTCPNICVDGTLDWNVNAAAIAQRFYGIIGKE